MKNPDICRCAELLRTAGEALLGIADLLESAAPAPVKTVTKEEVRAVLAAKTTAGYGREIRALLGQHGAAQLSDLLPEDYADLMAAAQKLGAEAQHA